METTKLWAKGHLAPATSSRVPLLEASAAPSPTEPPVLSMLSRLACSLTLSNTCRIRLVSDPTYATSMVGTAKRLIAENGVMGGFYSGFVPILFKQIPYTMAKFAVQGNAANAIYKSIGGDSATMSGAGNLAVSLSSGVIAGVAAAIISHPADTLLSKINKAGSGGSGSMMTRLGNIAAETGYMN